MINKEELHSIFIGIKDNNELAFNKLYEKYRKLVYAITFSILKNKENSEDLVQGVFIKLWRMEKNKLPTNNEASWLYSTTKNETLNFLRSQKEEINIDEIYYIASEDKELNEIIEKDAYNKIISRLNKEEQEIVSLKILSNLSFKEISLMLNMPIGTIQWKYYKSLHTLKILLSNLSMYIVTIGIFIRNRIKNKHQRADQLETELKPENNIEQEDTKKEQLDEVERENLKEHENIVNDNEKNENMQENTIASISKENILINPIDIGLISIANIFLIVTITFFIIFIKHQQNRRKSVSK